MDDGGFEPRLPPAAEDEEDPSGAPGAAPYAVEEEGPWAGQGMDDGGFETRFPRAAEDEEHPSGAPGAAPYAVEEEDSGVGQGMDGDGFEPLATPRAAQVPIPTSATLVRSPSRKKDRREDAAASHSTLPPFPAAKSGATTSEPLRMFNGWCVQTRVVP